jgi:hypothetical protein
MAHERICDSFNEVRYCEKMDEQCCFAEVTALLVLQFQIVSTDIHNVTC